MTKIHGSVWLLVGLLLIITSLAIDKTRFLLFALIGGIMVVAGVVKVFASNAEKKKKAKQKHAPPQQMMGRCRVCGYQAEQHHRFCSQCGFPLVRFH